MGRGRERQRGANGEGGGKERISNREEGKEDRRRNDVFYSAISLFEEPHGVLQLNHELKGTTSKQASRVFSAEL